MPVFLEDIARAAVNHRTCHVRAGQARRVALEWAQEDGFESVLNGKGHHTVIGRIIAIPDQNNLGLHKVLLSTKRQDYGDTFPYQHKKKRGVMSGFFCGAGARRAGILGAHNLRELTCEP